MVDMVGCHFGFDQHIIDVYFHCYSQSLSEHFVDKALISRACVLETERHYFVAIRPTVSDERHFS